MDVADRLLAWFSARARTLPWRETPRDPYRVLVSEVMLQQTQVDRVVPRYRAFLERFPDVEALAAAPEEAVLEAWSGLGYYRRARNLHAAARAVAAAGGRFPARAAALRALPGVGEYTAAAVASLAFGEAVPVLDGNVLRVGSRFLALDVPARGAPGRRRIAAWVGTLMAGRPPGRINEALMELGATVCARTAPACGECPLAAACGGRASGDPGRWPEPRRTRRPERIAWIAALAFDPAGRLLLRRIDEGPILRGLWLPPLGTVREDADPAAEAAALLAGIVPVGPGQAAAPVRHAIAHRRLEVRPVVFGAGPDGALGGAWRWADPGRPGVPTSSLLRKVLGAAAAVPVPPFGSGVD